MPNLEFDGKFENKLTRHIIARFESKRVVALNQRHTCHHRNGKQTSLSGTVVRQTGFDVTIGQCATVFDRNLVARAALIGHGTTDSKSALLLHHRDGVSRMHK